MKKSLLSIGLIMMGSVLSVLPGCMSQRKIKPVPLSPIEKKQASKPQPTTSKKVVDPLEARKKSLLNKDPKELSTEELELAREYALTLKNKLYAIKIIERLILVQTDPEKVRLHRLELANLYFDQQNLKEAGKLYREYVKLYPGSTDRDYAEYKAILCRFHARLKPPRDQSKTYKTLVLTKSYLGSTAHTRIYEKEVRDMQQQCYNDLFDYEKGIIEFHCYRKRYQAAQIRLETAKQEFLTYNKSLEPQFIDLEIYLAQQQNNQEKVAEKKQELAQKFPLYQSFLVVQSSKKDYGKRF